MAGDVDPYQAQWNLRPKVEALRAEAASLRAKNLEQYQTKESELGVQRDRLAREQYGLEQQAKSADIQVGVETKEVERISAGLAKREAAMAEAEKRGDHAKVQEDREDIAAWRAELTTHEARARQATLDAAELKEQAATVDRRRTELSVERNDLASQSGKVEGELDKMERQADLMQQARLKYGEADIAKDDIPRRAALELEAEALVRQATAIQVDRDVIRVVVPDLPATTPGYDADPGPLPAGAQDDTSSMGEPAEGPTGEDAAAAAESSSDDDVLGMDATTAGGDDASSSSESTDEFASEQFASADLGSGAEQSFDGADDSFASADFGATDVGSTDFGTTDVGATDFATTDFASSDFGSDSGTDFAAPAEEADIGFAATESFEPESFIG